MDKTQREYYLREQLKAIQKELGEEKESDSANELDDVRKRFKETSMPEDVRKAAEKEVERLSRMDSAYSEYTVSRTYLEWLLDLPWDISMEENVDIKQAQTVLDRNNEGLEKVKNRILEYLTVRQLNKNSKGPILCFVGPPGGGKTSLGRSIASFSQVNWGML